MNMISSHPENYSGPPRSVREIRFEFLRKDELRLAVAYQHLEV
jgi:hypothetical protein